MASSFRHRAPTKRRKVTEAMIDTMYILRNQGRTFIDIGRELNLSKETIAKYVTH